MKQSANKAYYYMRNIILTKNKLSYENFKKQIYFCYVRPQCR